jgi:ketosteroid isomerase-like protein
MKHRWLAATVAASLPLVAACGGGASAGQNAAATPATPTKNVPEVISALERDWVKAIVAKDSATVDRLIANDFAGTTDDMRYGKPEALEDVKNGTHDSLELSGFEIHVYGNTAIATMNQTEKSKHGTGPFDGTYLFTDTWVKRDGQWRAVASHGSRAR